jgi:hypothetical protein
MTDVFFEDDAPFAKGKAVEEGFDYLGREGWICVLDADTLLPKEEVDWSILEPGNLYSPYRKILYDPATYTDELDWNLLGIREDVEFAGYCQIFHASDPVLQTFPWYGTAWRHAGGCDSVFQSKWKPENKLRPAWNVLHLGPTDRNWCGRTTDRLDTLSMNPDLRRIRKRLMNSVRGTYVRPVNETNSSIK